MTKYRSINMNEETICNDYYMDSMENLKFKIQYIFQLLLLHTKIEKSS